MAAEHSASVYGKDMPISTKHAIEICNFIKGKSLPLSKKLLQDVMEKKRAVPFHIFKRNIGHKPGHLAAGRYPYKASQHILKLLTSLESNAQNKGLDVNSLVVTTIIPNRASRPYHMGRKRRVKMKRTHIQIIAEERAPEKKQQTPQRQQGQEKK